MAILPFPHYNHTYVPTDREASMERELRRRAKEKRDVVEDEIRKCERLAVLDGFALLEGCGTQLPDEGRTCDVSSKGLGRVEVEDLDYYTRLEVVDAGDNGLAMEGFGGLRVLRELRLHCNGIKDCLGVPEVVEDGGFRTLLTLDLSYNALTIDSLACLSSLPLLQTLDVTYNMLSLLPSPVEMEKFTNLKNLKAANNGFESDSVLISLNTCPRLSNVDLSYNYLQRIPKDVIEEGCFSYLGLLDLSHNYISEEEELLPAVLLTRLTRLLVYGNPLCGPTGEDETGECVDRVIDASVEARDGWGDHELSIITVGTRKAGRGKKNNLYRDLQMSAVVEGGMPTAAEWRRAGNRMQMVKIEGNNNNNNSNNTYNPYEDQSRGGTRGSSRGGNNKSRGSNNSRADTGTFVTGIDADDEEEEEVDENGLVVPTSLLRQSLNAKSGRMQGGDPGKLGAAIHALRYALKGSDEQGLDLKINNPRTGINRANASYRARALPKRPYVSKLQSNSEDKEGYDDEEKESSTNPIRPITPGIINAAMSAKASGKSALHELEEMLSDMNDRMEDIEKIKHDDGMDGRARTAGVASRSGDRAIGNLVSMVNNVVED
ncbi:hypothetical protein TrST_g14298 [Triparma strigata]|uniref:Uncharacterized protein n=1 Tax=Triparma strigata TaxID=1606541 RepID=A0A9W7C4D9_9STRA|nr:hypothetical protein TrST_g14298 [Triparma strigata]